MEIGTVPPRAITDKTIHTGRTTTNSRIITHYMQPHCPFVNYPDMMAEKEVNRWGNQRGADVWKRLQRGELSRDTVWRGYRDNLEFVLDEVAILLENISADKVVITSDHGNAVGEYMVYGHPPGLPLYCLREVPWISTSATDTGNHEPELIESDVNIDQADQLSALGYI